MTTSRYIRQIVLSSVISAAMLCQSAFCSPKPQPQSRLSAPEKPVSTSGKQSKKLIVIDPGHDESGSDGSGEAKAARFLAQSIKGFLDSDPRFEVFLTRSQDKYNPLVENFSLKNSRRIRGYCDLFRQVHFPQLGKRSHPLNDYSLLLFSRAGIANEEWAKDSPHPLHVASDAFVALHYNETGNAKWVKGHRVESVSGFCVYHPKPQPKGVDLHPDHGLLRVQESSRLALLVRDSLLRAGRDKSTLKHESQGVYPGKYMVLQPACSPSILLEAGYIYNPRDRFQAFSHPEVTAYGVYSGLCRYFSFAPQKLSQTKSYASTPRPIQRRSSSLKPAYSKSH